MPALKGQGDMDTEQNPNDRKQIRGGKILGVVAFVLHFTSAIFLTHVAVRCGPSSISTTYAETVTDSAGYALVFNATCTDPSEKSCFFGMPQSYDIRQDGLQWNVFALLAAFEWLSASFALYYLQNLLGREDDPTIPLVCLLWNAAGILAIMPYSMSLTTLQSGASALALLTATLAEANDWYERDDDTPEGPYHQTGVVDSRGYQFTVPKTSELTKPAKNKASAYRGHKNVTILHYTEYCASASLLFVAVLMLYVPDPVSWGPVVGLVGILLCNLSGIGAHFCKLDQHNRIQMPFFNLDWNQCGNHFKLFMLHSWSSLILALLVIFYMAWVSLMSEDVPLWVRFILYNLLVTYSLFGIFATICYAMAGTKNEPERFYKWMERLDYGLSVLSLAAKLPVAFTVYYGLVSMPGNDTCKVF